MMAVLETAVAGSIPASGIFIKVKMIKQEIRRDENTDNEVDWDDFGLVTSVKDGVVSISGR